MHIQIEHHSGLPVYRQIMDQISIQIASGLLREGDHLPSVRDLSSQLNVNPMTVSKALSYLEHDGLIARRPGRPLVVTKREHNEKDQGRKTHMENALRPAVVLAQQLGYNPEQALTIFKQLLEDDQR